MRRVATFIALSAVLAVTFPAAVHGQRDRTPRSRAERAEWALAVSCGTGGDRAEQLLGRRLQAQAPSTPVSYLQDPAVLTPDWSGSIALRDFTVVGDVPSIQFEINDENGTIETWQRTATRDSGGRMVSIFNPAWPASMLDKIFAGASWGWDQPRIYWGRVLPNGDPAADGVPIVLKIAPSTLPVARVVRLSDSVQYSGNVVNIVLPTFADGYLADEHGFNVVAAARRFYESFEDSYDGLAFVTQETFLPSYGGWHRNVRNAVGGIGLSVFDGSAVYGSRTGRLQGVEVFPGSLITTHQGSSHEIAHQWAAYIDWTKLTGLTRAGWQPEGHDPLWAQGETLIGAVLSTTRRVVAAGGGWQVDVTPGPAHYHPFTLYAMGLLGKDDVPPVTLFDDQGQFGAAGVIAPLPGTVLRGTTQSATIYNVIGMLGERTGPVPSTWSRATIVVSRDSLISPREMDYWTYFAQRLADPGHTGVVGFNGVGSFEAATRGKATLDTEIRPLSGERVQQRFDVDGPAFGPRDWRQVVFDAPVPTRYRVGDRIRWSGRLSAPDRNDISQVLIRMWKANGTSGDAIRLSADVSSASTFVLEKTFEPRERGVYLMELFLFWPGAGLQNPRASVSRVVVE
jgi:hypothetical protein